MSRKYERRRLRKDSDKRDGGSKNATPRLRARPSQKRRIMQERAQKVRKHERPKINLRVARTRLGYSIEDIAEKARIPMRVVEALETGDVSGVKKGPLLLGYKRQYLRFLGEPENAKLIFRQTGIGNGIGREIGERLKTLTKTNTTTSHFPAPNFAKLTATSVLLTSLLIIGLKGISRLVDSPKQQVSQSTTVVPEEDESLFEQLSVIFSQTKAEEPPKAPLPPTFSIRPLSNVNVKITVDGKLAHSGLMKKNREYTSYVFDRRLEFWTEDMSALMLSYNNKSIQPQGDISGSRKLVFAMDRADL